MNKFTPDIIHQLKDNEIFVFGSNAQGLHNKGSALTAKKLFGAIQGKSTGLQGRSYGICTKAHWKLKRSIPLSDITNQLLELANVCKSMPNTTFYLTKIGCNNAGYTEKEIAECLFNALFFSITSTPTIKCIPPNLIIPEDFYIILNQIDDSWKEQW